MMDNVTDCVPEIEEIRPFCIEAQKPVELEVSFMQLGHEYTSSQLVLMHNGHVVHEIMLSGREESVRVSLKGIDVGIVNVIVISTAESSAYASSIAPVPVLPKLAAEEMMDLFKRTIESYSQSCIPSDDNSEEESKAFLLCKGHILTKEQYRGIEKLVWKSNVRPFAVDLECLINNPVCLSSASLDNESSEVELLKEMATFLAECQASHTLSFVLECCTDQENLLPCIDEEPGCTPLCIASGLAEGEDYIFSMSVAKELNEMQILKEQEDKNDNLIVINNTDEFVFKDGEEKQGEDKEQAEVDLEAESVHEGCMCYETEVDEDLESAASMSEMSVALLSLEQWNNYKTPSQSSSGEESIISAIPENFDLDQVIELLKMNDDDLEISDLKSESSKKEEQEVVKNFGDDPQHSMNMTMSDKGHISADVHKKYSDSFASITFANGTILSVLFAMFLLYVLLYFAQKPAKGLMGKLALVGTFISVLSLISRFQNTTVFQNYRSHFVVCTRAAQTLMLALHLVGTTKSEHVSENSMDSNISLQSLLYLIFSLFVFATIRFKDGIFCHLLLLLVEVGVVTLALVTGQKHSYSPLEILGIITFALSGELYSLTFASLKRLTFLAAASDPKAPGKV